MFSWQNRLVKITHTHTGVSGKVLKETLVELKEVHFNAAGEVICYVDPCLFSEDEEGAREVVGWLAEAAKLPVIDADQIKWAPNTYSNATR